MHLNFLQSVSIFGKNKNPLVNKILSNLKLRDVRAKRSGVNLGECWREIFVKKDISYEN